MKTYLYRTSNLKSTTTFLAFSGSQFLEHVKKSRFLQFIHTISGLARSVPPTNTFSGLTFF